MPFFDLNELEERSFLSVVRHTVLEGELKLIRFSDSSRGHDGVWGRKDEKTGRYASFWMYHSEVFDILSALSPNGPYGLKSIAEISKRWAICDDWGDLGRTSIMTIPAGRTLNAYFGSAKFQPKISVKTQRASGRVTTNDYPGGSIQFVTRLGEEECGWVSPPFRTLDLSVKKLGKRV